MMLTMFSEARAILNYHYIYGFGDKGLDVSEQYGVTIAYSDIKDTSTGFHLRYVYVGDDVELP